MSLPGVWLVLACFGVDPHGIAISHEVYSSADCELQSYAIPATVGQLAHVQACQSVSRPDVDTCVREAGMVLVSDLKVGYWVPGQFFDPFTGRGRRDVAPALAVSWGAAGPRARSWVLLDAGAFAMGLVTAVVPFGLWLMVRHRRGKPAGVVPD